MKTHFLWPGLLALALSFGASGCYSVEFKPDSDYPNLRRRDVDSVEVRRSAPDRTYARLGILIIRDYSGDIRSQNFLTRIRREARARGAAGAWILGARITEHTSFEGSAVATGRGAARERRPTGNMRTRVGLVRVLLFNYTSATTEQPLPPAGANPKR